MSVTIVKNEVKVYLQRLHCSKCGVEMKKRDIMYLSYPPRFSYDCPKCGYYHEDYYSYPKQVMEEVNDSQN